MIIADNAPPHDPRNFQQVARRLASENGWFLTDQFAHPANARCHEETTGPEILAQAGGAVGAFVAGAGTGGTITVSDSAKVTNNLWGERWSKLVTNAMANGLSACTGLGGGDMLKSDPIRRFSTRLGSEAIRVGQAHGYQLEEILHLEPDTIARAGEGDAEAERICDAQRFKDFGRTAAGQKPSMGQDTQKGRRTEIDY